MLAGDLHSNLASDFLLKWSTLEALQKAKPQTVRKFYYGHSSRNEKLIESRLDIIQNAQPLTTDAAIITASIMGVQMLATQLRSLNAAIATFDREIINRFKAHPDQFIYESLPGAGPAMAPRLLAAFGADRERYGLCSDIQMYSGIAPVLERSGKRTWTHWRWHSPKFLRQTFHEFAGLSIQQSPWARAYYDLQRERGKSHHAAVRALAYKWIRIIYRCWKERCPYDESRYLKALEHHNSTLLSRLNIRPVMN